MVGLNLHPGRLWGYALDWLQLLRYSPYLAVMLAICAAATCTGLLLELIEEVWLEQATAQLDGAVLHWLRAWHRDWLDRLFLILTRFGNPPALVGVVGFAILLQLLMRRRLEAWALAGGFVGTGLSVSLMKAFFDRARPDATWQLVPELSPAFPSGHSTMAVLVYLFVAYLLVEHLANRQRGRLVLLAALLFTLGIGLSRLYLGVHWLSDVLAGYALGGLWLSLLVTLVELARLRRPNGQLDPVHRRRLRLGLMLGGPPLGLGLLIYVLHPGV